ncbi:MAG: hypothetical protein GY765_32540 [bacterium]|nr:hypothetical protein [bacterium]
MKTIKKKKTTALHERAAKRYVAQHKASHAACSPVLLLTALYSFRSNYRRVLINGTDGNPQQVLQRPNLSA